MRAGTEPVATSEDRVVEAEDSDDFAVIEAADQRRAESQFGAPVAQDP